MFSCLSHGWLEAFSCLDCSPPLFSLTQPQVNGATLTLVTRLLRKLQACKCTTGLVQIDWCASLRNEFGQASTMYALCA